MTQFSKPILGSLLILSLSSCSFLSPNRDPQDPKPTTTAKPEQKDEELYSTYSIPQASPTKDSAAAAATDSAAESKERAEPGIVMRAKSMFSSVSKKMMPGSRTDRLVESSAQDMAYAASAGGAPARSMPMPQQGYFEPPIVEQEVYDTIVENKFHKALKSPLSTFSVDVDTASYANVRRMVNMGSKPPADAVRIEELINYFDYNYTPPEAGAFSVNLESGPALWNPKHKIVRIGIKGKEIKVDKRPASNLVFLIDVSGSMNSPERLPLVKSALTMLVEKLNENDKISIVVYAGAAGLVLPPTNGDHKQRILNALNQLSAGGSTNGGQGIQLAYKTAEDNFIKGGVNRVILATDGDFNVGTTSREALVKLVQEHAKNNVYLSLLGFGMGNYKDGLMESLSNKGNGNYAYIDSQDEAKKVMVDQMCGTLVTIAKDVKLQVEFNPKFVESYKLIGYENRVMKNEDFNNDKKDAGDIGAGHTVTALYEIIPAGTQSEEEESESVDSLKYGKTKAVEKKKATAELAQNDSSELLTVKIRYKKPDGDVSTKQEFPLTNKTTSFEETSESFRFASSVAMFGLLLRNSELVKDGNFDQVLKTAKGALGEDKKSYRQDFIDLVKKVKNMDQGNQIRYTIED